MSAQPETPTLIEAFRTPAIRHGAKNIAALAESIRKDGLRHPVTAWTDGTLLSGTRRLHAYFWLNAQEALTEDRYRRIPAVFVDTIEDATKRLLADNQDETLAVPMKPSDMCRLWDTLIRLDEPAHRLRIAIAHRRGVALRRQTQTGKRQPGRSPGRSSKGYTLSLAAEAFGMSEATAFRLMALHKLAQTETLPERAAQARDALQQLDEGHGTIWGMSRAVALGRGPTVTRLARPAPPEAAPAPKQLAAWDRAIPQLEGLVAGLTELGPPNPDLTWDQIGPTRARLMKARRDLEKIIRKMSEKENPAS
jgi:hypothetical protein